jgi:DNA-binding beta-propeller fold protein YncE
MRVDPRTNCVVDTLLTGRFSSSLTLVRGLLWVAGDRTLIGLDARGGIARRIQLPHTVIDIATAGGKLYGTDEYGSARGRLLGIDPARARVMRTVTVGPTPVALAAGPSTVWVANFNGPSVTRISQR